MRNFDISTSNWKRSGFPGESEIWEVKREESEGGAGQVDVDCCVEDLESVNLPSLGDLSPKALNYIQQLESELSSAKKVFGEIAEGHETLQRINEAYVDDKSRPYKNIRIKHTYILDDPFDDPSQLSELIPDASPEGKPKDESQDDERE
ncbi:Peptidyl-prolyl cis-trans isomerase CYP59 [Camellia lanceoleosa]|uniref:Peptidyl-prolyl cis-trans isomerase CYP59 n=1 Tax=Camellia lanceoleosa TaxID=1840588 RepID=A0ACC0HUP1_9ERIC|nr:Peptidyl-prolyl cis-trans isomerase CYP59 [Camellia lanceoleosa]